MNHGHMNHGRLVAALGVGAVLLATTGCKRLVSYAIDKELGDDAGLSALESSGSTSKTDVCKLLTTAEVEAATGQKVMKVDASGDSSCGWVLSGGSGPKSPDGMTGNISLQIAPELAMKIVPMFGEPKVITGLGDKAEWVGGMAPNLRVHKGGQVLNFLIVDPGGMLKNPGITEKPIATAAPKKLSDGTTVSGTTSEVNMEYPELEKEAVTLAKDALTRY